MLVQPSARRVPRVRFGMLAMFCGAFLVRTREASSQLLCELTGRARAGGLQLTGAGGLLGRLWRSAP
jgi:hypothetical protein